MSLQYTNLTSFDLASSSHDGGSRPDRCSGGRPRSGTRVSEGAAASDQQSVVCNSWRHAECTTVTETTEGDRSRRVRIGLDDVILRDEAIHARGGVASRGRRRHALKHPLSLHLLRVVHRAQRGLD